MKIIAHHESLSEYVAAALDPPHKTSGWKSWLHYNDPGWTGMGVSKLPEVAATVRTGWQDGAGKLEAARDKLDIPRIPCVRRRAVWSDRGDSVDMPRVYAGRLDQAWRRVAMGKSRGTPRVRIVVDAIAPAMLDADAMFWKGAAAALLADQLTAAGYAVEVISAFRGDDGGDERRVSVVVKPFSGPASLCDLAASCASPAFFRIIGHAYVAGHDPGCYNGSMSVNTIYEWDKQGAQHVFIAPQSITDETRCHKWIAQCVATLTATAEEEVAA